MARIVAAVTADVVGSSRYDANDRRKLDRVLRAAFREAEQRFKGVLHTRMTFRITAGDEFQFVVADVPRALHLLTYIRASVAAGGLDPPARFRASLGVGELSTPKRASSYEEDGSAFLRSRRGLEDIARRRGLVRWTKIVTGTDGIDASIDAVLCLGDFIQESWTVTQWEAIRWALLGATREDIAKRLHIAHQNVTKRLLAAGCPYFADSADYVRRALVAASDTHQRVQRKAAP